MNDARRVMNGAAALVALAVLLASRPARAFWVLNFSTAQTVAPGHVVFIGGTGGQLTSVGHPLQASYTPFLAHAGIRFGIANGVDAGYRLVTVPMPWSAVGPTLGSAVDVKLRLTPMSWHWQLAFIAGGAVSYLLIADTDRFAWSPGVDVVLTRLLGPNLSITLNARYAYTAIPSAAGGADQNYVHAFGPSVGMRFGLTKNISVLPELGFFRFQGAIGGVEKEGLGMQYGAILSASL